MSSQDIKEKLIILGITTGIFLPIRVLFTSFISEHWLGSLGLVSAFGIVFLYLIKKNKLGWFGEMFDRQMKKTIGGKTGKYVLVISLMFLFYFGLSLYFMDRGATIFDEDKQVFFSAFLSSPEFGIQQIPKEELNGPKIVAGYEGLSWFFKLDYALSIAFSIMNDTTDGWLSHFVVVIFVEQLEIIILLCIYRRTYKKTVQLSSEK